MLDNWLSNQIFKSYDDLVDHCCEAWSKLADQPWRIMSTGLRLKRRTGTIRGYTSRSARNDDVQNLSHK